MGLGRALHGRVHKARGAPATQAPLIALHTTTPIMTVAQPMYLRMGFKLLRDAPAYLRAVPYAVYTMTL